MKRLLFAALLFLSTSSQAATVTYDFTGTITTPTEAANDWSGEGKSPTWVHAIGEKFKGTLRIYTDAVREYLEERSAAYEDAASVELEIGGAKFVGTRQPWLIGTTYQGVGAYVLASDTGLHMNIDFGFNIETTEWTLAEAANIPTTARGGIGFDAWEGTIETNFGGGIDSILRRNDGCS